MANVPIGVEIFPKIPIIGVGCTNVTDRQTDGRTTTYSAKIRFRGTVQQHKKDIELRIETAME